MARQVCVGCGCRYSAGAPCCPQCRATECRADYEDEEGGVAKLTTLGGVSHPEPGDGGEPVPPDEAVAEPEPAAEPPDPTPDPGPGQGLMPPPSSPASSGQSGEPEAPAAPSEPAVVTEPGAAAPAPAPKAKPAPSLSRAKDPPAEITGSGGVVLPKPEAADGR